MADHLASDDFAVLRADDELHEAFGRVGGDRLAECAEWELADLYLDAARLRLGLAVADAGDFGLAIDASGDRVQIESRFTHTRHNFHSSNALGGRLVREEGRA